MSAKLNSAQRYKNPAIRSHLASQYVLATLSSRVQRRFEALLKTDPELEREVYQWQQRLDPMNNNLKEVPPPERVWSELSQTLNLKTNTATKQQESWWHRGWTAIPIWRSATAMLAIITLSIAIWPSTNQIQSVDYLAVLQSDSSVVEPELVIAAYKGAKPGESHLHLQWNDRVEKTSTSNLTLWTVSRENGQQISLGPVSVAETTRLLTPTEWKLIKNSAELLLIEGNSPSDPVRFRGPCLQLNPWNKA
ncbi:anti-sigma factor [Amphritea sp. HPY]|uniref:anti-sigma factor n=1 Tax=Amphritea sp. HPY TaxID=3421652 RepID=UPI003D7EEEBE